MWDSLKKGSTQVGSNFIRMFPFAKMEFGLVAGIAAFKLRAITNIGIFEYFSVEK